MVLGCTGYNRCEVEQAKRSVIYKVYDFRLPLVDIRDGKHTGRKNSAKNIGKIYNFVQMD